MAVKDTFFEKKRTMNCGGKIIDLSTPKVMGILNITPDSFYDGGKLKTENDILKRCEQMIIDGADIIDVGAISTRPGSKSPDEEEEWKRLQLALPGIRKQFPGRIVSVDTFRADIAKRAVEECGADMINDVSAGEMDENMFDAIAELGVPYIMMHMQGTPENMQNDPKYDDVVQDVIKYFAFKIDKVQKMGVKDIIIDPGFGFGKTVEHNFELLKHLEQFKIFGLPMLVGVSRKSMINKVLKTNPEQALTGTISLNSIALNNGANIIRVHDVQEAKQVVELMSKII